MNEDGIMRTRFQVSRGRVMSVNEARAEAERAWDDEAKTADPAAALQADKFGPWEYSFGKKIGQPLRASQAQEAKTAVPAGASQAQETKTVGPTAAACPDDCEFIATCETRKREAKAAVPAGACEAPDFLAAAKAFFEDDLLPITRPCRGLEGCFYLPPRLIED